MPNHTTVKLTVEGNGAEKFIDNARGKQPLEFESLYPTPSELLQDNVRSDRVKHTQSKVHFPDWYEWRILNWGTKWDCYDHHGDWSDNQITFFTAWSPPTALFLHVSNDYPDVRFKLEFADEGAGFLGSQVIKKGELISETQLQWHSEEGIELRDKLGVNYPEDEELETT